MAPNMAPTNRLTTRASGRQGSASRVYVLRYCDVEIHYTAHRHGIDDAAIRHAIDHALSVIDLEPDADPPKILAIGPDHAGNLLEVIWLDSLTTSNW